MSTHHESDPGDQILGRIETRLRDEGARANRDVPTGLHGRIMGAVQDARQEPVPVEPLRVPVCGGGMAASLIILLGGLLVLQHAQQHRAQAEALAALRAENREARALIAQLSKDVSESKERELESTSATPK